MSDSVVVAYNFDEADSYQNSTAVERPASSMAEAALATSIPVFSTESPTGDEGDYSIFFAGDDTISYDDNGDYLLEIVDEPFTFEVWLKFNTEDQVAARPIFLAYGLGGAGGYSFSFRPAGARSESVADSRDRR